MKLHKIKSRRKRVSSNLDSLRRKERKRKKLKMVNEALKVMQYRFFSLDELESEREKDDGDKLKKPLRDTANCLVTFIDPSIKMIRNEQLSRLSEEAKEMIKIVLKSPKKVTSHTGIITKDRIISHFRKKGWKYPLIWNVLGELAKFVKTLN